MSFSDKRIQQNRKEDELVITIKAFYEGSKHSILFAWIVLWTACGLYISTEYFRTDDRQLKLFLIVWTAFWVYFEFKVLHAYRWRKNGREEIILGKTSISINRLIGKRGIPQQFDLDQLKNLRLIEVNKRNFFYAMNASYWTVSGERLAFDYKGKTIGFGLELTDKAALEVLKKLKHTIKDSTLN